MQWVWCHSFCQAQNNDFDLSTRNLLAAYRYIPLREFKPGMRFVVSPVNWSKKGQTMNNFYISADYRPGQGRPKGKSGRMLLSHDQLSGKAMKIIDIVERKVGKKSMTYLIFEVQGMDYLVEYELDFQLSGPKPPRQEAIEYLCYYDEIEALSNELVGRQVYLRDNKISYYDPKTEKYHSVMYSKRFTTARITKVEGWFGGTIKIGYQTEQGDYGEVEVIVSGTNLFAKPKKAHLMKFERYFLLESPRFMVQPEVWERIERSEIWKGMSTTYARLAAGDPERIYQSGSKEKWVYPNRILYFESGKLYSWKP